MAGSARMLDELPHGVDELSTSELDEEVPGAVGGWSRERAAGRATCRGRGLAFAAIAIFAAVLLAATMRRMGSAATRGIASGGDLVSLQAASAADHKLMDVAWRAWVKSKTGHRRQVTITAADPERVKVHYDGFPSLFDEWIDRDSDRIVRVATPASSLTTTLTTSTVTTTTETTTTRTSSTSTFTTTTATTTTSTSTTTPRRYTSVFCFTLARSDNHELALVRLQLEKSIGLFDCDGQMVFSDVQTWLSQGPTFMQLQGRSQPMLIETVPVPANLHDVKANPLAKWTNVKDYMECWDRLIADGRYKWHDWVAKVDPDTVFLPGRLRDRLRTAPEDSGNGFYYHTCKWAPRKCVHTVNVQRDGYPDWGFQIAGTSKDQFHVRPTCDDSTSKGKYCRRMGWGSGEHVIENQDGHKVYAGNCCTDHETVKNVLSKCPQQQTESPESGMSGALELLSRKAVDVYATNYRLCKENGYGNDVGEEFFMQACMKLLRATSLHGTELLSDTYCGGVPNDCSTAEVAFHPFKTTEDYMGCVAKAVLNLKVPELHDDLLHTQQADG
mmetsp:Transcript_134076/g.388074  ORF Transcript_134076/g.388074 Transcript_134076/m.388074 type:complete len:557 (+) Transcript_134076:68-1738(+)|eukprot:CAMPEP_0176053038 /NCGR_PEP_ID=MMETSP0120_2-20121206/26376_1 /TAXON_ID=160619 /ORGANISM="Kryptoperidinium foliaceum, Strain CCMP 1326" /LENGTH=556 /DNA_ID=CAMNT_0017386485 /DNA_START=38 /DNA_END=1708 /DNA_ORIENTATION=+